MIPKSNPGALECLDPVSGLVSWQNNPDLSSRNPSASGSKGKGCNSTHSSLSPALLSASEPMIPETAADGTQGQGTLDLTNLPAPLQYLSHTSPGEVEDEPLRPPSAIPECVQKLRQQRQEWFHSSCLRRRCAWNRFEWAAVHVASPGKGRGEYEKQPHPSLARHHANSLRKREGKNSPSTYFRFSLTRPFGPCCSWLFPNVSDKDRWQLWTLFRMVSARLNLVY